ncbi:polymorphic toxin-type HINT domain-containing protein [Cellulosilyticum sp. ST5]|nr:hypothetical protein EKH84_20470 [Cellulosilyticum sp. WCF-2]
MTAEGLKSIEDIQVGANVYAENPETGEKGLKEVQATYIHDKVVII